MSTPSTTTLVPSEWGANLRPSPTLSIHKYVQELLKHGVKVILLCEAQVHSYSVLMLSKVHDFGIGEMQPEICVPEVMKQGMKDAIDNDQVFFLSV
jgi:hypothetical protein